MRCSALAALAACLALAPAARADTGAPGVGDPYFPRAGNGGYDALHYDLDLGYDFEVKEQDRWLPIANGAYSNLPFPLP